MTKSILDTRMQCPECSMITTLDLCEPDIDGDGSPGCPRCLVVEKKKVAMKQLTDKNYKSKYFEKLLVVAIQARDLVESAENYANYYMLVSKRKLNELKEALEEIKIK